MALVYKAPKNLVEGAWYWLQWSDTGSVVVARYEPWHNQTFPWNVGGDSLEPNLAATKAFMRIQRIKEKCPFKEPAE